MLLHKLTGEKDKLVDKNQINKGKADEDSTDKENK